MLTITQLPFRKYGTKNWRDVKDYVLPEPLILEQWIVPTGTIVKLRTSPNFGLCCLPVDCRDKRGFIIPRRLFRW